VSPRESFAVEHAFKPDESTDTVIKNFFFNRCGLGGGMSSQTMEKSLEVITDMVSTAGSSSSQETHIAFFKSRYCEIALHPTLAGQLAEAGFSKKALVQWLYEHTRVPWDRVSAGDRKLIKSIAASGSVQGLRPECRFCRENASSFFPLLNSAFVQPYTSWNSVLAMIWSWSS
jgi:hypothetical protein